MKIVISDKLRVTSDNLRTIILTLLRSSKERRRIMKKLTLIIMILGVFIISNAQIEKKELKLTQEMEKMVLTEIKKLPEGYYSHFDFGIKNKEQLEHLHTGKPIPSYMIVNDKLEHIRTVNVPRISDWETLSLRFENSWNVPVMSDEAPLLFVAIGFSDFGDDPQIDLLETANIIEHFHNYEYKDSIIGSVCVTLTSQRMDHFIIRKDNQDIFVEIYDKTTGEYFKNEYNFSELINHIKELYLREKEARMRYYDKVANKSELELTPEITKMLINKEYSIHIDAPDWSLSEWGIKDRAQLEHLHLGKPIPRYIILNENLTFSGNWQVPVMSNGEPISMTSVKLDDDNQYIWAGCSNKLAGIIHNYEYKYLIIGCLGTGFSRMDYLIIRRDNKDIFVKISDYATDEYLKNEYSFSEVLNLLKQ